MSKYIKFLDVKMFVLGLVGLSGIQCPTGDQKDSTLTLVGAT